MDSSALWRYLVLLAASLVIVLILHIAASRINLGLPLPLHPQLVGGLVCLAGYPVTGALAWWSSLRGQTFGLEQAVACLYGLLVYSCLSFTYIQFFNITETARRFRILYELSRNRKMSPNDLQEQYRPAGMLTTRLGRLVEMRQLRKSGNRYLLDNQFLYSIGRVIMVWTRFLKLPVQTGS